MRGFIGDRHLTTDAGITEVADIHGVVSAAVTLYGSVGQLPFQEIIQSIRAYEPRSHRKKL